MGVSKNNGTPKSSNFNRVFHDFHHPFWGTIIFGNTHIILTTNISTTRFFVLCFSDDWKKVKEIKKKKNMSPSGGVLFQWDICWVRPPPSNSDHQNYYIFW